VTAREFTPSNRTWRVFANAVCADAPVGYKRVTARSALSSTAKSVSVACPAGKTVMGPAARVSGGNGHVVIDDLIPSPDRRSYSLMAFEDPTGTPDNWSVTVSATCVNSDPVGTERVVATSQDNSQSIKTVNARCSPGKRVIGVGADITGGSGSVALTAIHPSDFPNNEVGVAAEEIGGNVSQNWFVRAYALCALTA
jgi:hypothetical protein